MKSALSVIRWKFVIPVVIVVAAMVTFFVVFLDPLLTRVLESSLSRLNEAKVDISGLKTKIFQGRISMERVQITDRDDVMKNVVDMGPLAFELNLAELVKKRIIIPEAMLSGLRFNTARKTSGELKRIAKKNVVDEKPGVAEQLAKQANERFQFTLDGLKDQAKSKIEFDAKELDVVKQSQALKVSAEALPEKWKTKIHDLDVDGRLKAIDSMIHDIKSAKMSGSDALSAVPENLKKVQQVKSELDRLKSDIKTTRSDINNEIASFKTDIAGLKDAKNKDVANLMSRFNLDFANPTRIAESMLGPVLLDRVKTALYWIQLARKNMPSKKDQEQNPPKPRAMGMDIPFPTPAALPRFWLAKAALSGEFKDVRASGELKDVTSNPVRIGKPTVLSLEGTKDTTKFIFQGLIDQVSENSKAQIDLSAKGLPISDLITSGFMAEAVTAGSGSVLMNASVVGEDQLKGSVGIHLAGLKLAVNALAQKFGVSPTVTSTEDKLKSKFVLEMAKGIEAMPSISASVSLSGTLSDPKFDFDSNLISQMDNVIKASIGSIVADQKKELESQLNQILNQQQGELGSKLNGLRSQLDGVLGEFDSKIQSKISESTGLNVGGVSEKALPKIKIPSLDKLFK